MRKFLVAITAVTVAIAGASAATASPQVLEGDLAGAPYKIVVPDAWNGTLVMLAHGYRDKADAPGQVDDRRAFDGNFEALAAGLAGLGYAVAGSAYRDNGWAVKEGMRDTQRLASFFNGAVGRPGTTLLVGFSLGSVITYALAEQTAGHFDGSLAACAVGAGTTRTWDGALAHLLAYDAAFGMPASWGTPGDVRDDLHFDAEVLPKLLGELADPLWFGKTEFIRLVTRVAGAAPAPPASWLPAGFFTNMYFLTEARAELERRAGGPPAQNLDHVYWLTPGEQLYLGALGIDAGALLAEMNARRFAAKPSARNYLSRWADYGGKLRKPLLTLHTEFDTLVPPSHQTAYAETVAAAGRSDLLYQAFTDGDGHCNFTPTQLVVAIGALEAWAQTGVAPTPASFPAFLGFHGPGFAPEPWPFP